MISDLLGEALGMIHHDRERPKHSINGVLQGSSSSTSSPSISPVLSPSPSSGPSPSSSTVTTPTSSSTSSAGSENLRCPRCDSTNTKFCYYNNYNLTQPRHFCKTCRRYWTKGGALRNVPIGGGCRKNKTSPVTSSAAHVIKSSTAAGKFRAMATEIGKSSGFMSSFDHEYLSSASNTILNPILWTSADQNPHILSLLRANQNPNPSAGPMPSSTALKEEVSMAPGISHGNSSQSPVLLASGPVLNSTRISGLDASPGNVISSFGIKTSSLWRENERQHIGFVLGETQGATGGAQDLYQRLRSSSSTNIHSPAGGASHEAIVLGNINNVGSASSSSLTILDSAPVAAADQLSCWNPILSWSDLSTTHGAYP